MAVVGTMLLAMCWILSVVSFICFVAVLLKMFQHEDASLAMISIVLTVCSGIGVFLAFIGGWMGVAKYDALRLMGFWTAISIAQFLFCFAYVLILIQEQQVTG
ncbi:hypothetical protein [Blastopirellula marina]|uniref:Uncharacterized protein n=1 Tax=Blastopirellula marina TaxID=124 RepID=A0A2S8GC41_9BACT|nr:hypothetical protein [Blastopirellula marina]PQO42035.1 hypothetical protein C5Y93_27140 [Blastopirellula marina]